MTALLGSHEARIDVRGAVLLDGLTFESRGDALGLVGGWEPLFALAAGRAQLAAGTLAIRGVHPQHGVRDGRIGLALAEITFPEGWNALDWLVQSAELAGIRRRLARQTASSALAALGLAHYQTRRISTLTGAERRALAIAHATLTSPEVLLLETPFEALDERSQALVAEVIQRAAHGRALIASTQALPAVGAERALFEQLGDVAVIEAGSLIASGSLAEALPARSRYAVSVLRHGPELAARLSELGLSVTALAERADGSRLFVELGDSHTTDDLLDAALAADAPIVELVAT